MLDHLTQRAIALLAAADTSWSTVTGALHSVYQEDVLHPRAPGGERNDGIELGTVAGWYHFWSTAAPWQLRMETVRQVIPRGRDAARMPDVLIEDRRTWRAKTGAHVTGGRRPPDRIITDRENRRWVVYDEQIMPDPGHRYSSHGVENLHLLLRPAPLLRAFQFTQAISVEHRGRAAIQVEAAPGERDDFHRYASDLVAIGADPYTITIDAIYGIVLEVEITIKGQLARRHVLSDVLFDSPIDSELFAQAEL